MSPIIYNIIDKNNNPPQEGVNNPHSSSFTPNNDTLTNVNVDNISQNDHQREAIVESIFASCRIPGVSIEDVHSAYDCALAEENESRFRPMSSRTMRTGIYLRQLLSNKKRALELKDQISSNEGRQAKRNQMEKLSNPLNLSPATNLTNQSNNHFNKLKEWEKEKKSPLNSKEKELLLISRWKAANGIAKNPTREELKNFYYESLKKESLN